MPKKLRKEAIPQSGTAAVDEKPLRFSFKHIDLMNPKFLATDCCAEYFCKLLATLQRFSTWNVGQFVDQNHNDCRHIISFDQTTEPEGFQGIQEMDRDQIGYLEGWQFAVCPDDPWGNRWRAHGILVDDTLYVIWLDPNHELYPLPQ